MLRGSLSLAVTVAALLLASSTAAAESWTLLWEEDFADGSDWTLYSDFVVSGGKLDFNPTAAGAWLGPNYRTDPSSVWSPPTNPWLDVTIDNFVIEDIATPTANRQGMWSLDPNPPVSMHDPNAAPAGSDWLEFRVGHDGAGTREWVVVFQDDGSTTTQTYPFGPDAEGKKIDINFTISMADKRYWFNGTVEGVSSVSNTNTWSGDGPFAEASSVYLTYWGLSSVGCGPCGNTLDYLALYGQAAPPPQPVPPTPRKHVHADFGWAETELGTQFYDRSVGDGAMVAWNWSFGDGYGSRREHPFHTFMCAGNYTIVLQVEDEYGEKGSVSAKYQVNTTRPLCGVVTRGEEGIHIEVKGYVIDIPTGLFIIGAALSAGSLIAGVEIPFLPKGLRYFLLFISVMGLALTLGLFGFIAASLVG